MNLNASQLFSDCVLCPRRCHVDRTAGGRGYCGMSSRLHVARAALHMWEEPCLSGKKGSGTVFFTGCSLKCIYCQNREIALGNRGYAVDVEKLSRIFLHLQDQGAANINLVTACHFVPLVAEALMQAKEMGLTLPVVYNSGGYEEIHTLSLLEGLVDIYLPDYKYADQELARVCSHAPDYPKAAQQAIFEMVRQTGECVFDEEGYLQRGTIVRHLILPGHTKNSTAALTWLFESFGNRIYYSIMNQYTPLPGAPLDADPVLRRHITRREYEKVLDAALALGIQNGFFQEGETCKESFIPSFDGEGITF